MIKYVITQLSKNKWRYINLIIIIIIMINQSLILIKWYLANSHLYFYNLIIFVSMLQKCANL